MQRDFLNICNEARKCVNKTLEPPYLTAMWKANTSQYGDNILKTYNISSQNMATLRHNN